MTMKAWSFAGDLAAIESGLEQLGLNATTTGMQPGASPARVRAALGVVGLESSPELEEWFGWHDGIVGSPIGATWMMPGYFPSSLDRVVANQGALLASDRWNSGWLPLLEDGGGYFYVLDQTEDEPWPIRRFRNDWVEHPIEYASLEAFAASVAEAYASGVFRVNDEGYLDMSREDYALIARRHNPGIAWWQ